ncbi:MAG: glycosyltransferase [Patescibacteria group bacterium]
MSSVLIVIPAHNEELVIERNIRTLYDFCSKNLSIHDWNILVASNGSADATAAIGARLSQELPRVAIVDFSEGGRGRTLRRVWGDPVPQTGCRLRHVRDPALRWEADILVYMDADLSTDLEALPKLLEAVASGADVAIGSRFAKGAKVDRSLAREVASRGYRALVRIVLGLRASDAQCGFKAIGGSVFRELAPRLRDNNWFFDTELLLHAERRGYMVAEIPVSWVEDRVKGRKSTVRLLRTIIDYIKTVVAFGFREGWRG